MTHDFKQFLVTIVLFLGLMMMSVKAEVKNIVSYDVSYKVNYMPCISELNSVRLFSSIKMTGKKNTLFY